jgi:hypothetical protein
MKETRVLTSEDAELLASLYAQIEPWRSSHQPKEKFDYWKNTDNVKRQLSDKAATFIGTFENGKMISSIRMSWWQSMPHWSLGNIVTSVRTLRFNMDKNGLADSMRVAIEIAEGKGCYRFYTAISERQVNQELFDAWPKYVPELKEYLYVIEFESDGGTSGFPVFDILINSAKLPSPYQSKYYIRSATASNARRNLKILKEK